MPTKFPKSLITTTSKLHCMAHSLIVNVPIDGLYYSPGIHQNKLAMSYYWLILQQGEWGRKAVVLCSYSPSQQSSLPHESGNEHLAWMNESEHVVFLQPLTEKANCLLQEIYLTVFLIICLKLLRKNIKSACN